MKKRDTVINFIKEKIKNGEYKPGSKIMSELMLAEYLHISRSTVREALKELSFQGIIDRSKGDGTYLKKTDNIKKKYILFISTENATQGYIRQNYRYFIDCIKRNIEENNYSPLVFIKTDLFNFKESLGDLLNEVEGIIAYIPSPNDRLVMNEMKDMPIVDTFRLKMSSYPFVFLDFRKLYKSITEIIEENNYKNNIVFSVKSVIAYFDIEQVFEEKLIFGKYNFNSINFLETNDFGLSEIRDVLDNIKTIPDSVIFLDDNLYNVGKQLFKEYNHIFSKTRIITHANDNTVIDKNYPTTKIMFNLSEMAKISVDLLLKIKERKFVQKPNIIVSPTVIEVDNE